MSKFKTIAFTRQLHSLKASIWMQVLATSSDCKYLDASIWMQALDASI